MTSGLLLAVTALSGAAHAADTARTRAAASAACPWVGSVAPVPTRVSQVLGQMTPAQKLSMVSGIGSAYVGSTPAIPALCIPAMTLEDGPAGVADGMTGVTQLPAPVGAAATWDTAAEQRYGTVIGSEQAGKGTTVDLGPTVNMVRDPRWGRAFEANGEDPYLAGTLGAAQIRGIQNQGVMAQVKHLAVYNQETNRNSPSDNAVVDTRTMQELYLPAFQAAAKSAVSSAMCSYSVINSVPACENAYLMSTVLDGQFAFPGFVTSDWGGTHSTVASAKAGLDMEMPSPVYYGSALQSAIDSGQVPASTLTTMVGRILTEMFAFGMFDRPATGSPGATVSTPAHVATGLQVAEEGTVLLKNSGGQLPLSAAAQPSVAVLGGDGSTGARTAGGGSAAVHADSVVTPLQGITARAGSGVNVTYAQGGSSSDTLPNVPASALTPASGGGNGLTAQFYNNTTLSGTPVLTQNNSTPDFSWGGASPGAGVNSTNWSAKWTGTLTATSTGLYTFAVTSDDGTRLTVNGTKVVDQWHDQAATTSQGTISLTAGQHVPIELDYYQGGGDSTVGLAWAPPDFTTPGITQAVDLARNSSVAVVFADVAEGEGSDLSGIDLPGTQNQLIERVAAANPHTVVVLNSGSAVTMPWIDSVSAVLENWYPGQSAGTAIAALLYGDVNPSGKLPVTFPKSLADVPAATPAQWPGTGGNVQYSEGLDMGYRWYQAKNIAPLFPFGYGLSYTSFSFSGLSVPSPDAHGGATVTATVTNTGSRAGADVAQLYIGDPAAAGEPPAQLKGFQRVDLQPGASARVSFPVTAHDLATWSTSADAWTTATGAYRVMVGDTSASPQLSGTLNVTSAGTGNAVTVPQPAGMSSPAGAAASLTVTGSDSASGQTLGYSATGLPAGLSINSSTGVISGTATTPGTTTVDVTATDGTGATGTTAFVWTVTPQGGAGGPIVSGLSSTLCLDVKAADNTNGTPVQTYTCNGTGAQAWSVNSDGTVRALGKCLDVNAAGTANGSLVQLYDCNGTGAQNWQHQSGGAFLNPSSGRCLDVPAASTTIGTQVEIYDCNGTAAQNWTTS